MNALNEKLVVALHALLPFARNVAEDPHNIDCADANEAVDLAEEALAAIGADSGQAASEALAAAHPIHFNSSQILRNAGTSGCEKELSGLPQVAAAVAELASAAHGSLHWESGDGRAERKRLRAALAGLSSLGAWSPEQHDEPVGERSHQDAQ